MKTPKNANCPHLFHPVCSEEHILFFWLRAFDSLYHAIYYYLEEISLCFLRAQSPLRFESKFYLCVHPISQKEDEAVRAHLLHALSCPKSLFIYV